MAGSWGSAKNNIRIGFFYDGIETNSAGTQARLKNPRFKIDRGVSIVDTTNKLSWSGAAITDGSATNLSLSGSGEKTIKTVAATWITLTSSTQKKTASGSLSGVEYAGGTLTVSVSITYPAKSGVAKPAAPTNASVARVSDTQQTVSWTRNATSEAPYTNQIIERWDVVSDAWRLIATIAGTATSYADTTTTANQRYQYRVSARNAAGDSAAATTGLIATTPASASNVTATRAGSNITFTWTPQHNYAIEQGVWIEIANDWGTAPAAILGPNATTWTLAGADTTKSYWGAVHAKGAEGLFSEWAYSNKLLAFGPPSAPTVTASSVLLDVAQNDLTISWVHKPVDATEQSEAELQYRSGGGAWTAIALTTQTLRVFTAGTLSNGNTYEFQVRTKGGHATWGAWSASVFVQASAAPSASILTPAAGVSVGTSTTDVAWTYHSAEGLTQAGWRVALEDDEGNTLVDRTGNGTATSWTVPWVLADSTTYLVRAWVRDSRGVWSLPAERSFLVEYAKPHPALLDGEFSVESGSVELTVSNLPPGVGEVAADRNEVQRWDEAERRWATVVSGLPAGDDIAVSDPIPPLHEGVQYRVITWSEIETTIASAVLEVDTTQGCWVYLNGGPGWGDVARMKGNLDVTAHVSRERVLHTFAGYQHPHEAVGEARERSWRLAGAVAAFQSREDELGDWRAFEAVADLPAPLCYRDPMGRREFVSIDDVTVSHKAGSKLAEISATLTRVHYDE